MTGTHPFDEAIHLEALDAPAANILRGHTHPEWANMVGPFGGITAAAVVRAIEDHPDRIGEPLALTVNFAAPVADGDFDVRLRIARSNRTNQHWLIEVTQDDGIKTTATALFGVRRDTWADTEVEPPSAPTPEQLGPSGVRAPVVWGNRYDMRFVDGKIPTDQQPRPGSTTTLWVRDAARRRVDYPALAALCDAFFPRVFLRRGGFVPAGTISLTSYFHASRPELESLGGDFVLGSAHADRFANGYFDQSARLWTRDGVLLATTYQIVYFKG